MKTSRFIEEQIAFAIKQHERGTRVEEICRKMVISDATFSSGGKSMPGLGHQSVKSSGRLRRRIASSTAWWLI